MTCHPKHSQQDITDGIHISHAYEYADSSARTGASGFTSTDIGKIAKEIDTLTWWVLTETTPTWVEITNSGTSIDNDAIHDNVANEISGISGKTDPVFSDLVVIEDSADGYNKKSVQVGDLVHAILIWGDDDIATSTTVRYLTPGYDDSVAETTVASMRIPYSGVLKNLRVRHNSAGSGSATITYTVLVNGSGSSLVVAMSNTAQDGSDLVNSANVSAGDLIAIRVNKSSSISSSPDNIVASLEVAS